MQPVRRDRLTQDTVISSPSISGDLRLLHTIDCGDQLLCCQFNNEGTRIAGGLRTGAIKVYSVNDGLLHHVLNDNDTTAQQLPVTSLRFMPRGPAHNGDVLLATYSGGNVKLWHVSSRTCMRTLKEDRQTMICSFNASGNKFFTGGTGPGIYMYDSQTWEKLQGFQPSDSPNMMDGHMSRVYAITFFPESDERFVTGGWDDTVQFWNTQSAHSQRRISGPHICGDAVSIDKSGTQILTGSWRRDNTLQIWDAETGAKIMDIPEDFRGHSQIYTCHFLGPDHIIAGGSRNNSCRLIDKRILMSTGVLNDLPGGVYSTHISSRGILAATSNSSLYLAQTPFGCPRTLPWCQIKPSWLGFLCVQDSWVFGKGKVISLDGSRADENYDFWDPCNSNSLVPEIIFFIH